MPTLLWSVEWDWGAYPINVETKRRMIEAIRERVEGHRLGRDDIGKHLTNVEVRIGSAQTSFTARLERIDPPDAFIVDHNVDIQVYQAGYSGERSASPGATGVSEPSLARDLEEMVMFQRTFDPYSSDSSPYMAVYQSLVGIPKKQILREMMTLLMPFDAREEWSTKHYGRLVPSLGTTASKAPVIVMGGDPGTGKTALATSIGAPLAREMGERVHFRHMSLMLRGMGYQGRASGMIVKLFEHIRQEYLDLREPIILFFDEAEAVVGTRRGTDASSGAQENIAVVDAIIVGVDGLRKGIHARIVALFATNLTDRIDAALMRRSYYHYFDRPDEETRRQLLEKTLQDMNFGESDIGRLVEATKPRRNKDGLAIRFTPSDIVERIVGRALNEAILKDEPVSMDLLLRYCSKTHPTGLVRS